MKRLTVPSMLAGLLMVGAAPAHAEFTGDVKLACEAILCLSSGQRPSECAPSLDRYFGIKKKKMSDTISARLDFLNQCPTASYDNNMKSLVKAIANGAGRCDAGYLNATLARVVTITERQTTQRIGGRWTTVWTPLPEGSYCGEWESCQTREITVIDNKKPAYCVAYDGHSYTWEIGATYVGEPYSGGHWED